MKKEDNYFLKEYVKKIGSVKDDYESKSIYRYERNKKIKILKNLLKNTNDNILDFGCSNGSYFDIIKDLNFQKIFGLDISSERLSIANQRGYMTINSVGQKIPLKDKSFRTIICIDVLVNILKESDQIEILKELERILDNDSHLILSIPNKKAFDLTNTLNKITKKRKRTLSDYNTMFEVDKMIEILTRMNFQIEKVSPILFIYPERIAKIPLLISINDFIFGKILHLKDYGYITYIKARKK
jgi:ubiquinone/menaquinone biosynthesis C-methylase UbiE